MDDPSGILKSAEKVLVFWKNSGFPGCKRQKNKHNILCIWLYRCAAVKLQSEVTKKVQKSTQNR